MKKIDKNMLNIIKSKIEFYNFDELISNNNSKIIIDFNDDYIERFNYSDIQYHPDKADLVKYKLMKMKDLLNCIVDNIPEENCLVINYGEKWMINENLSELSLALADNEIQNDFDGAINIKKTDKIFGLFIDSVIKYNSFVQFIFVESQIIISPSDHMDIFLDSRDNKKLVDNLSTIISKSENIFVIQDICE